ncbi:unnamed protein product [Blepharisma stoltei]|uniref:Uncharacterized protein n=1 Tax=Blepharisma stoltei TaxID=1481888 RepID=A0AAU9KAJ0_9CILI|nr:unnamed protein product [Blepharisma stoltei]
MKICWSLGHIKMPLLDEYKGLLDGDKSLRGIISIISFFQKLLLIWQFSQVNYDRMCWKSFLNIFIRINSI